MYCTWIISFAYIDLSETNHIKWLIFTFCAAYNKNPNNENMDSYGLKDFILSILLLFFDYWIETVVKET